MPLLRNERKILLYYQRMAERRRWFFPIFITLLFSSLLILIAVSRTGLSQNFNFQSGSSFSDLNSEEIRPISVRKGPGFPPVFAYLICGTNGEKDRVLRLLKAVYHPRNRYLISLDAAATEEERKDLAFAVRKVGVFRAFGNVDVLGKPDMMNNMGSSTLAAVIHAAAVLLRIDKDWDWFISLNSADYPIVTQDDLLHVFSSVTRNRNFIDHTSDLGWKEYQRVHPIIVDPGLYLARKSQIFYASQKHPMPETFKFFTGSPWFVLSREVMEFCVLGWDNLPRILLLYFTNIVISTEGYFHTVICNSPEFMNTTVNSDIRYFVWDTPPQAEPQVLNTTHYEEMMESGAAFARRFAEHDHVLDMIDRKILKRRRHGVVPGGWCLGKVNGWTDPCLKWGNVDVLRPGLHAKRLEESISKLLSDSISDQCK